MYKRIVTKFFWNCCLNSRVCNYGKRAVIGLLWTVIKRFIFFFLDLNVNEWVPINGCIYWGYGQMDPRGQCYFCEDPGWVMIILLYRLYVG